MMRGTTILGKVLTTAERAFALSAVVLLLPLSASAQVFISEIMYDLDGSDSGREWIEIHNVGDERVDLTSWRFRENETNHKLNEALGGLTLARGDYAVIADSADRFLTDHSGYNGILIDSAFSLNNSGERLELLKSDSSVADSVNFSPEWGAEGDGASLQYISGEWRGGLPTPGAENMHSRVNDNEEDGEGNGGGGPYEFPGEKHISVRMNAPEYGVVGADTTFSAVAYGTEGEPLKEAAFIWNMGDGVMSNGEEVLHVYRHPGEYVVYVDASNEIYSAHDRKVILVLPADISLALGESGGISYVEINNEMRRELDLSGWHLVSGELTFTLPEYSRILAGKSIRYDSRTTGIAVYGSNMPMLLYPNGTVAIENSAHIRAPARDRSPNNMPGSRHSGSHTLQVSEPELASVEEIPASVDATVHYLSESVGQSAEAASQAAVVEHSPGNSSSHIWIIALGMLMLLSTAGIYMLGGKKSEEDDFEKLLAQIEIIE